MPNVKLTSTFVLTASCPAGKTKIDYFDTAITGFVLEVRKTGGKTYALRYRDAYNRQKQYRIGAASDVTCDHARKVAQRVRSRVTVGEDPSQERAAKRSVPTFAEVAKRFLEHVSGYKRAPDVDERYLRLHILPKFGRRRIDEIHQTDVSAFLKAKLNDGYAPATVNRFHVIINHLYKLAKRWGIVGAEKSPTEGLTKLQMNNERERFLSADEADRLKVAIEGSRNKQLKHIVALLLLTGARKRELLDAKWEDFDSDRRVWRIPLSKSGKARFVPLSGAALAVLDQLPRWKGCPYLVPNPNTRKPFNSIFHGWDTARKEAGLPEVRMHDLRHTAASNLVNSGQSLYVVSKVLGHAQQSTTQRYAHLSQDTLLAAVDAAADVMGVWPSKADEASSAQAAA
ncbi:site-specific integrase [Sphingomonas sp.]|uniref:site-specific integrase n=1 Tax=Sphingomonas sp. TaxID=28214 RepID=UPI000DAFA9E2|nr:site-specific integrase [Sphingomonas sp.]PZU09861.1 MAG: integrase [Sphingomonas sp.]